MILTVLTTVLLAQSVVPEIRVTSEFVRRGPGREILSPALPRNGWTTFHVTVTAPSEKQFGFYIGQNPEKTARAVLFRDGKRVDHPITITYPAGKASEVFRLDLWIGPDAPVGRAKVEPQLWIDGRWIIYPMEIRIVEAKIPEVTPGTLNREYLPALRAHWCEEKAGPVPRNLKQDLGLAGLRQKEEVRERFATVLGVPVEEWCADQKLTPKNPEWYLRFRDWLLH